MEEARGPAGEGAGNAPRRIEEKVFSLPFLVRSSPTPGHYESRRPSSSAFADTAWSLPNLPPHGEESVRVPLPVSASGLLERWSLVRELGEDEEKKRLSILRSSSPQIASPSISPTLLFQPQLRTISSAAAAARREMAVAFHRATSAFKEVSKKRNRTRRRRDKSKSLTEPWLPGRSPNRGNCRGEDDGKFR